MHSSDQRQQIEILRRFSAEVLNDKDSNLYRPYTNTEQIEPMLMRFFFEHTGITHIALYYGCPEIVIMEKILSMDLYSRYDEIVQKRRSAFRAACMDDCDDLYVPCNQHERDVEALRRATPMFDRSQFEWTEERKAMVFWLFKMGEDITDIALRLGCPEWMVMQDFIEDHLYDSWADTPWFRYSNQECRDRYIYGLTYGFPLGYGI